MGNMPNTKLPASSGNSTAPVNITKQAHPALSRATETPASPSGGGK